MAASGLPISDVDALLRLFTADFVVEPSSVVVGWDSAELYKKSVRWSFLTSRRPSPRKRVAALHVAHRFVEPQSIDQHRTGDYHARSKGEWHSHKRT